MTDGCAAKPQSSNGLRRAWVLTPKCKLSFDKDNLDTLINMNQFYKKGFNVLY